MKDVAACKRSLYELICVLATWLHLICGLSVARTIKVMKFVEEIVLLAIKLGILMIQSVSKSQIDVRTSITLPHDVHTAINALCIEPTIVRSICCPRCFAAYSLDSIPEACLWRESPQSKLCNEPLWTTTVGQLEQVHVVSLDVFTAPKTLNHGSNSS